MADRGERAAFVVRHWRGILRGLLVALLAVVVLQNVERTRIDVLFWSLAEVPKLVLILASMLIGVGVWEILKALRRP
jgi:uncharacterized integral membrane protein